MLFFPQNMQKNSVQPTVHLHLFDVAKKWPWIQHSEKLSHGCLSTSLEERQAGKFIQNVACHVAETIIAT